MHTREAECMLPSGRLQRPMARARRPGGTGLLHVTRARITCSKLSACCLAGAWSPPPGLCPLARQAWTPSCDAGAHHMLEARCMLPGGHLEPPPLPVPADQAVLDSFMLRGHAV